MLTMRGVEVNQLTDGILETFYALYDDLLGEIVLVTTYHDYVIDTTLTFEGRTNLKELAARREKVTRELLNLRKNDKQGDVNDRR